MFSCELKILNFLHKSLDTRDSASLFFKHLNEKFPSCSHIQLDFDEVEFMSRSFADQFHKERITFQNEHNALVELVNVNIQIIEILQSVSRTQTERKQHKEEVHEFTFNNLTSMKDYIFSW